RTSARDGAVHGEVTVKVGETQHLGHMWAGGGQADDDVQGSGPVLDANHDAQAGGVAERHPGQVEDEQAGAALQGTLQAFAYRLAGAEIELAAQAHDGGGGGDEPQACPGVDAESDHKVLRSWDSALIRA